MRFDQLAKSCKKIILQFFLGRFLQEVSYFARKDSFLVQDLARKILARFAYFFQDDFYWVRYAVHDEIIIAIVQ